MNLLSILGGNAFVMFNKEIAKEVSVNGAIIFGQLCSSYESFGSKEMLTIKDGKEFFFLTAETLEEETALSYKQQVKAIKDLEEAGYIQSVVMGSPARKYFHITDKIFEQFRESSSDKREELNEKEVFEKVEPEPSPQPVSIDQRENQGFTKGENKDLPLGHSYKEINKKNKIKKNCNKDLDDDKRASSTGSKYIRKIDQQLINSIWESVRDEIPKRTFNAVLRKVKDKHAQGQVDNFRDYFVTALTNKEHELELRRVRDKAALEIQKDKIQRSKNGHIPVGDTVAEYKRKVPLYNWLED